MSDDSSRRLRSPRLGYRRLTRRDVDLFHALCRDAHLKRYLLDGADMSRAFAAEAVEISDRLFQTDGVGLWLVERDGGPIGFTGFRRFPELCAEPQLLYAFVGDHVGSGYATEAVTSMLSETRRLGWSRVVAAVDGPNLASIRVLRKTGFRCCGRVPGNFGHTLLFERFERTPPDRVAAPSGSRWVLRIEHTWDGDRVPDDEVVSLTLELADTELIVRIDAPFHDDPPPETSDLWHHEVVELMLLGADDAYVEVEVSPHGKHLVLFLKGARNVVHRDVILEMHAAIDAERSRWRGVARVPLGWIPFETRRLNAFATHGAEGRRRYLAWRPAGGARPDFHCLEAFGALGGCMAP